MSKRFTHNPNGSVTPHQPPTAKNPWTNLPAHDPSTQQSNAWNPWTNPPAPPPNMSHHYTYQPVRDAALNHPASSPNMSHHYTYQPVRNAALNLWTHPLAPVASASPSSAWSNHSFPDSVRLQYQPNPRRLWTDAHPLRFAFDVLRSILLRICYHRFTFCRRS